MESFISCWSSRTDGSDVIPFMAHQLKFIRDNWMSSSPLRPPLAWVTTFCTCKYKQRIAWSNQCKRTCNKRRPSVAATNRTILGDRFLCSKTSALRTHFACLEQKRTGYLTEKHDNRALLVSRLRSTEKKLNKNPELENDFSALRLVDEVQDNTISPVPERQINNFNSDDPKKVSYPWAR